MSPDPPARYVSGHGEKVLYTHAQRDAANSCAYLLPHLDRLAATKPALRILDVGCGPGSITIDLARRYPSATVMGVEHDAGGPALTRARQAAQDQGVGNACFGAANIHTLRDMFAAGEFDVVHAHQVLQHCGQPVNALRQMRAVAAPGGLVAVRTADMSAISTYPVDQRGLREWQRLWLAVGPAHGVEMCAGALQYAWAREAGFDVGGEKCVRTLGTQQWVTREQREEFAGNLAERILDDAWKNSIIDAGLAAEEELQEVSGSIREWGSEEDGLLGILNGEMVLQI